MAHQAPDLGRPAARDRAVEQRPRHAPTDQDDAPAGGRRRLNRDEKKAQTRRQLLDAAAHVFTEKGFFAATIDDVAEQAGFSKGAVYSNFDSKEDLFYALMEERHDRRMARMMSFVDRTAPVSTQALESGQHFIEVMEEEEDWEVALLEFRVCTARNPELHRRFAPRHHAMLAAIAELIERAARQRGTELTMPAEHVAVAVDAMASGIEAQRRLDPGNVPDDLFGRMLAIFFEAIERPVGDATDAG